ncbi:hypothetical protein EC396_13965 [Lutibacter sp. HS1-25]|nr:hypothetical protein EC396_13965 [Lutibacter sp. HS1-25]
MKLITAIFLFLAAFNIRAQELPPVQNYLSKDYGAENQNWAIAQSNDKSIYVANNIGLLEFNGAKWQLYPSANNSTLRSVSAIDGKIYTGGYMEFGYWEKNDFGNLIYTSLSDGIKEDLIEEDIWKILNFDSFILFQSLKRLYIYDVNNKSFKIIGSELSLPKLFKIKESIYFQKLDEGLFRIENGEPILISDDPIVQENILVNILDIDNKLLFQTQEFGTYQFIDNKLVKWEIPANQVIANLSIYSSIQLRDGTIVIGTISDGIFHLDQNGNIINSINQEQGLNNNTVLSMFEDVDGNLWLGLDNGISVVNFNSAISVYNDLKGKLGSVYASAIFNNKLYLGTNQGLFYKNIDSHDGFQFINNTYGQVWCLKVIDNTLFCGHNSGTYVVNGNNVELISDIAGTWDIKPIKNKGLLMQGHYNGLSILEKKDGKWQLRNKLKGFDISSRFFELVNDDKVFVNHETYGVINLSIDKNYTKTLGSSIEKGAPKGLKSGLVDYDGQLLYTSSHGVFKFNAKYNVFNEDEFLTKIFTENDNYVSGKLIVDSDTNTLWGFSKNNIIYLSPGKLDNVLRAHKIAMPTTLRNFMPGFESLTHLYDKVYLFGTSRGYIKIDLNKLIDDDFEISINSIEKSILDTKRSFVAINQKSVFKSNENNLYFQFCVPEFDKYVEVNYQYQLEGMYNQWSDWSTTPEASFKNLPFGDYTFSVKAKIGNKLSENIASYTFRIQRPWYISNIMIALYFVLLLVIILVVHFVYKRNFNKQKRLLLLKKQRELAFSQLESEKVIMKLKNDKLQHEIDSKTRELASSTMSIIKKNEILNTIKSELVDVKNDTNIKPVLKIINKNLSNTDDWEMFQEAFNQADSDFLKKVKTAHPALTPNDLRLCAYLRLNLASKEIAPLLNISVRSIEIKRYRLRKKMDLPHEKSLVEYILEL